MPATKWPATTGESWGAALPADRSVAADSGETGHEQRMLFSGSWVPLLDTPKGGVSIGPEQFNLPLEDVEVAQGVLEAAREKARRALKGQGRSESNKTNRNCGHLPKHLPRIERIIEPETRLCPCGCGETARIGEDVSERLDGLCVELGDDGMKAATYRGG
ncbi:MAG: hypothetical protein OEU92_06445 [Alphaproteobacteria bacterium]|nr:hypothetical protein [Alphaproteobacteria bacterium]